MHWGGARGQNLGHLSFFFIKESFVFEQQILFRIDSLRLATSGFCAPGVGQGVKILNILEFLLCFAFIFFDGIICI